MLSRRVAADFAASGDLSADSVDATLSFSSLSSFSSFSSFPSFSYFSSFSSFSSRIRFIYGTAFCLRPRFFGVGVTVEVDAASVPFATGPAAACAFLILLASFFMEFFRRRVLLVIVMTVVNEVALVPMST